LKNEQEQLRQASEESANPQPVTVRTNDAPGASANAALSAAERSELLRLRGEIGGLRRDLAQETNQLAALSQPGRAAAPATPGEPVVSKAEITAKLNLGKQSVLALLMYAQDHDQRLPATLAEAMPSTNGLTEGAEVYELVQGGLDLRSVHSPARTIVLRGKPWKGAREGWQCAYAFADGHVEVASSGTPDFTQWENQKQNAAESSAAGP
jgi:prepilin-type processing-associated H-X9-DG protein